MRRAYGRFERAVRRRTGPVFGGLPKWAKPSTITAATGVTVGVATMVFTPLSDGDSWMNRLRRGYATYQESGNPFDILNYDSFGNGAIEVGVHQLSQNAFKGIGIIAGSGIVAGVMKRFGL